MPQQRKLDCPICNHRRLTNVSDHLTRSHNISGKEKKALLRRYVFFSVLSRQPEQPHPSVPQSDSTPGQCGYTVPGTSSLPSKGNYTKPNTTQLCYVLMIVASVMREFEAPMFLLWIIISQIASFL